MRLDVLKEAINEGDPTPRAAPRYIIWIPPHGSAVECPPGSDIEQAGHAAARMAGRHPGVTVAVYELVGTTRATIVEPEFVPSSRDAEATR